MKTKKHIAILLATYNGAPYLPELLDSLRAQTVADWRLYVRDDGSTDTTADILSQYAGRDPRLTVMASDGTKRGALGNFMQLLQDCNADYYFFCDQDDVWFKDKIARTLQRMEEAEAMYPDSPIIVHTDLTVTDSGLHVTADSFWDMSRIAPPLLHDFKRLAGHYLTTGCTMAINSQAKAVAWPYEGALMHDSWITARVLQAGGHVIELERPTLYYRQHEHNAIGAHDTQQNYFLKRLSHIRKVLQDNVRNYRMLRAAGYGSCLTYIRYKVAYYFAYRKWSRQRQTAGYGEHAY